MTTPVEDALGELIEVARMCFGETEYRYYKLAHVWHGTRRNGSYFSSATNKGTPITKEQYDANVAQGKKDSVDAFMERRKGLTYYTYEREVSKNGWYEELSNLLKESKP
jgi:hypothetical protein